NSVLDFAELHDRLAARIDEVEQVVVRKLPRRDVAHEREKIGTVGVELDFQSARGGIALERCGAGPVPIGIGEFTAADHALGRVAKRCRCLCERTTGKADKTK